MAGYAGGSTPHPTYRDMGDHTECVRVEYDPRKTDYAQLLLEFWKGHEALVEPWCTQYRSLVLWHNSDQKQQVEQALRDVTRRTGQTVYTLLAPAGAFHPAEDYHQKYFLRMTPEVLRAFRGMYPDPIRLAESTAAARANAVLGGYANRADLLRWLPDMSLDDDAETLLLRVVSRGRHGREERLFP